MTMARVTSGYPESGPAKANLLAERQVQLEARRTAFRRAVARLAAALLAGAVLLTGLVLANARVTQRAFSIRGNLARITTRNAGLAAAERAGKARQAQTQFLGAIRARHARWVQVMAVAGQVTPRDMWIRRIVVQENAGQEVLLVEGYSTSLDQLPAFMRTLGRAVGARQTQIDQVSDAEIDGRRVVRFASRLVLRPGGATSTPEPNDERSPRQTR
jgi:hypothetical protein